jgi:hypothetical protein
MNARALMAAVGVTALAAACGDDPSKLDNGDGIAAPPSSSGVGQPGNQTPGPNGAPAAKPTPADNAPPPGVTDNKAKAYFVMTVYPSMMGTCGSCHAPPGSQGAPVYLSSTSATDAYNGIEARGYIVPNSMLLKKGAHEGPALTADQVTMIAHWMDLETEVRGAAAPVNLMAKLGNCLDQTKFTAIGLANLRTVPRTNENTDNCTGCNNEPCQTCHSQGEMTMHAYFQGNLGTKTFDVLKANGTSPQGTYLISKYITTNGTNLVPGTGIQDKATVTQAGPRYSHPMFKVSATMSAAITAFAQDAITKFNAKQCGQ